MRATRALALAAALAAAPAARAAPEPIKIGALLAVTGPAADGVVFPGSRILVAEALPDGNPQKPVLLGYKRAYEGRYQEEASAFGGYAHDAFTVLAKLLKDVGPDREKVRAALETTKGFVGMAGVFTFTPAVPT